MRRHVDRTILITPELDARIREVAAASRVPAAVIIREVLPGAIEAWARRHTPPEPDPAPSRRWVTEPEGA